MTTDMARLYNEDFYAWTQLQARELRRIACEQSNLALDLPHLAEEVRDLGKEQRHALRNLLRQVIVHLLLLQFSPADRPRAGWRAEIIAARANIADRQTGTLQRDLKRRLPDLYEKARDEAAAKLEAHGEHAALPERSPYGLPDVMKRGRYPETHATPEP